MLTGHQAFEGEDVTDTLSRVLQREPDWALLPANIRPRIRELLKLCLQKDARKRRQTAADVRIDMEQAMAEHEAAMTPFAAPQKRSIAPWAAAAVLAVVALALGVALWEPWRTEPLKPLVRLEVDLGADVALPPGAVIGHTVIISPDGTRLVYIASVAGAPHRLYTRRLDQAKATELPGTEGAQNPLFSPDGQWIGFFAGNRLNKISVEGGAVVPLTDTPSLAGGAAWGMDGRILIGGLNVGMRLLLPSGGQAAKLTDLGSGEVSHAEPQFLPGGKFALFTAYQASLDATTLEAISLSDGKRKMVQRRGTNPNYLPSGHLVYVNYSTLFAIPFDLGKLETNGTAIPILDDLKVNSVVRDLSFASTGTLVYRKGGAGTVSEQSTMQWIDAAGKRSPFMTKAGIYGNARLSPDAKRLAVEVRDEGGVTNLWVYDAQRNYMTELTFGSGISIDPVWTPDGRFIIFQKPGEGIFWIPADGSGQPQPLIPTNSVLIPWSMSPAGKWFLAFFEPGKAGGWIQTAEVTEDGAVLKAEKPKRFFESTHIDFSPEFSPDGRWIAYMTQEAGRNEVMVRAFPAPASGQGWLVSTNGADILHWSRNSHELLYQDADRVMAVSYTVKGDSFVADKPSVRVEKLGGKGWDLAPDGRIAVVTPVQSAQAPAADHTVVFLLNFFDYLRQRVPVGR
jgi:serine/threonine-protein kinase